MKRILLSTIALGIGVGASGCMNLDEKLVSGVSSEYYATAEGLNSAVTASYANLRGYYGREQLMSVEQVGTDTWMSADQSGSNNFNFDAYDGGFNSQVAPVTNTWNPAYTTINSLNAALDRGPSATGVPEATKQRLLGEAHFLRAMQYFTLVRFFGDVTLTLHENKGVQLSATRAPADSVYRAIIADLDTAVSYLPNTTAEQGRATKAAALALRSKVYLTRAYKSYSPNAQADFTAALNDAKELINNKATYNLDLEPVFADLWCMTRTADQGRTGYCDDTGYNQGNHKEFIFTIQFSATGIWNAADTDDPNNGYNYLHLVYLSQYESNLGAPWVGFQRDLNNGRPFRRAKPTPYELTLWRNKWNGTPAPTNTDILDTRFDGSFQTVYYANTAAPGGNKTSCNHSDFTNFGCTSGAPVNVGDTALVYLPYGVTDAYRKTKPYYIMTPCPAEQLIDTLGAAHTPTAANYCGDRNNANDGYINWQRFPALKKFQDNLRANLTAQEGGKIQVVMRLGEIYLLAAEADVGLNNPTEAATFINVLRDRAASPAHKADGLNRITAGQVDLNFVMDERERELAGEHVRWMDITRPGKDFFLARVRTYSPHGANNVQDKHYLRPIPQTQIDAITLGPKYPQNTGW